MADNEQIMLALGRIEGAQTANKDTLDRVVKGMVDHFKEDRDAFNSMHKLIQDNYEAVKRDIQGLQTVNSNESAVKSAKQQWQRWGWGVVILIGVKNVIELGKSAIHVFTANPPVPPS